MAMTMVDPNPDRNRVIVDGLGNITAVTRIGRKGESVGDNFNGPAVMIEPTALLRFLPYPAKGAASQS